MTIKVLFSSKEDLWLQTHVYEQIPSHTQLWTTSFTVSVCTVHSRLAIFRWGGDLRTGNLAPAKGNRNSNRWRYIRRGSFAPLLRFPGGRPACIVPPPAHPSSVGPCFDGCCPCCQERCTCRSTERFESKNCAPQLGCGAYLNKQRIQEVEIDWMNAFIPLIIENTVWHI